MKGEVESDGNSGILCRSEKLKLSLTLFSVDTMPKEKASREEKAFLRLLACQNNGT